MNYANLMRNAAKILFWVSVGVLVATLLFALSTTAEMTNPMAMIAGVASAFGAAVWPFACAAIIWRIDIWLFDRGNHP